MEEGPEAESCNEHMGEASARGGPPFAEDVPDLVHVASWRKIGHHAHHHEEQWNFVGDLGEFHYVAEAEVARHGRKAVKGAKVVGDSSEDRCNAAPIVSFITPAGVIP